MLDMLYQIDCNILLWIQNVLRCDLLTAFFVPITKAGNKGLIWIILSLILLIIPKTRKIGILSIMALVGSVLVNNIILKNLVERVRPYEAVEGLQRMIAAQKDFSFPSGHTGSSFAAAMVMWKKLPKKIGIWPLVLAILIGFSRLYVGVHYPSDVIAAAVIGTILACLTIKGYERIEERVEKKRTGM